LGDYFVSGKWIGHTTKQKEFVANILEETISGKKAVGGPRLTPWSRVLLEKLTVNFAARQEIPRIYGTRKFLTIPTSARHLSLS
jgi:hypothetical protein